MGYLCDTHPDTPGALLITNLDNGDTAVLCGNCVHPWADAIAAATAPDTLDEPIDLETSDPLTGDPTHDDSAGDGATSPGTLAPAESPTAPAPAPEPDDGDELEPDAHGYAGDWMPADGAPEPASADA